MVPFEVVVMAEKIFIEKGGMVLRSDSRDFVLPVQYKMEVLAWCRENKIIAEHPKHNESTARFWFGMDIWRIKDEKQRMWFALRWS